LFTVPNQRVPNQRVSSAAQESPVGLVRGQTVVCAGSAAVSCALGLVAGVTQAGSWAAVVGMPSIGALAASSIGVVLERTVFIGHPDSHRTNDARTHRTNDARTHRTDDDVQERIGAVLSALIDGIDLVVISRTCASAVSPSLLRRLQTRAQSKGGVLVIVGESSSVSADIRLTARTVQWEGLGEGYGHLRRRLVTLDMDGRRCPRPRTHTVWLPDTRGALAPVDTTGATREHMYRPEYDNRLEYENGSDVAVVYRAS
jgi:threonine dehydrogenase-like Zn-dependent dehydrogenase